VRTIEKSIFNFKILYEDGKVLDLHKDKDLWVSSFRISSPDPEHITSTVEGKNGSNYHGTTLKDRKITSTISVEAWDYIDFDLARDEIFSIFNPLKKFYIIRDLQPAKRMLVSVNNSFEIDYDTLEDGEFSVEFVIHSVFLESVGTTLDEMSFEKEKWQFGQGLIVDETKYIHSSNSFRIFNAGNIDVDPREFPLEITFKGNSNNLKIINKTTGDTLEYSGTTTNNDLFVIDRIRVFKNGLTVLGDTNRNLISLATGWNDFTIEGTTGSFEISFNFRFYYF
jgi:hypothetical protein